MAIPMVRAEMRAGFRSKQTIPQILEPGGQDQAALLRRARRRTAVRVAKYVLPLFALALLGSIAVWPQIARNMERGRATWKQLSMVREASGVMLKPRYRGVDAENRPYTMSAEWAKRVGPERIDLDAPIGDISTENGGWLELRARQGAFMQHSNELDLSGKVWLYRSDGTTVTTDAATMNLKQGAGDSDLYTHAEGPFGTLDAQGFTMVNKGHLLQFHGPARLVLNAAH